jgi:hypothetical protein
MARETGPPRVCERYITNSTSVLNDVLGATVRHGALMILNPENPNKTPKMSQFGITQVRGRLRGG